MKNPDQLTIMAERYCIVSLLSKNKDGLSFRYIKNNLKIKEKRLKARLRELEEKGYVSFEGVYRAMLREE